MEASIKGTQERTEISELALSNKRKLGWTFPKVPVAPAEGQRLSALFCQVIIP